MVTNLEKKDGKRRVDGLGNMLRSNAGASKEEGTRLCEEHDERARIPDPPRQIFPKDRGIYSQHQAVG